MFPDIAGEQGFFAIFEWGGRIAGSFDGETAVGVFYQPGPAGTEVSDCGVGKFILKIFDILTKNII